MAWKVQYGAAEATGRGEGERVPPRRVRGAVSAERTAAEASGPLACPKAAAVQRGARCSGVIGRVKERMERMSRCG